MTAPIQTPDLPMAHAQVELTTGDGTTEICVRMIHDSDTQRPAIKLRGTITELWPRIVEAQREGYGAFFVVNAGGDTNAEINSIRACFIDADNVPLPDTWHLPPDFTVQRDEMHWHAHWRVLDVPVDRFRDLQRRLAAHYGTDPAVCNPSRVMRLAGTLHQKDKPTVVTLADMTGGESPCLLGHTVDEIARGLPEIVAPNTETPKASAANGLPISADAIKAMLRCIPPSCDRNQWLIVCGGLGDAPVSDPAFDGLAVYTEWSCGDLHGVPAPDNFKGDDDCADEWQRDQSKRAGGASVPAFGALVNLARKYGYDGPSQSFSAADTFAHATELVESNASEDKLRGPIPFRNLLSRTVAPIEEIIPGLIEKRIPSLFSGPGGTNKSRLLKQLGISINSGAPVFGRPTQPARFVYFSYEDHEDEVARSTQAIVHRLGLPSDSDADYWDLTGRDAPFATVHEDGECRVQSFGQEAIAYLKSVTGHKFVGIDSCYNALRFVGSAKINEGAVMAAIGFLQRICDECDCTILVLWHPSQAGQERGDASGWSVAWHNAPRARLSISAVKDAEDTFELRVEKRNHGPKGKPITLHWCDGALLPRTETDTSEQKDHFTKTVVHVAILAAEHGAPIQKQPRLSKWIVDEIERAIGRRPAEREIKEALAAALPAGQLRYVGGSQHRTAGYYPADELRALELSHEAKRGNSKGGSGA